MADMASVCLTSDLKIPENMNKEDISDESALQNWENNLRKLFSTQNPEIFIQSIVKFMEYIYASASSKAYLDQISVLRKYSKTIMNLLTDDSMNILICYVTKWIIEKIIDEDRSTWCVKRELLKCVNAILLSNRSNIYFIAKIVKDMPPNYLCKILDSLSYYGDFDLQATILEAVFAIYGKIRIIANLKELIPDSIELRRNISQIKENTFDEDCRTFLNIINKKQKNIFSLQCKNIQINGSVYVISVDDKNGIWVDFNLLENGLSWYQNTDSDQTWELITLFSSEVGTAFLGTSLENFFVITLKLVGRCVTSVVENQDTVNKIKSIDIIVERSVDSDALISKVLPKILSQKFKQSSRTNPKTFKLTYQPLSVKVEKRVKYRESKDTSDVSLTKAVNPISFDSTSNVSSSLNCSKRLSDFEDEELDITSTDDPNKEYFSQVSEETVNSRNTQILAGRCTNKTFNYREIIRSQDDSFQDGGARRADLSMLQSSTVLDEIDENKLKKTNRVFRMLNLNLADTTENENVPESNAVSSKKNENIGDAFISSGIIPDNTENQHNLKSRTFILSDDIFYSCSQVEIANNLEEGIKEENKLKKTNRVFIMRNFDGADTVEKENIPESNAVSSKKNENIGDGLISSGIIPDNTENPHNRKSRPFTLSDNVFNSCSQVETANNPEEVSEHLSLNSRATKKNNKTSQQVGKTAKNVVQPSLNFEEQVICTLDAITETSQNSKTQFDPMTLSPRSSENDVEIVAPELHVEKVAESDTINKLVKNRPSSNKINENESDESIDNEKESNKKVLQAVVAKKPHQCEPLKQINTAKEGNRDDEIIDEVNLLNDPKMSRSLAPKKLERENNRSSKINKSTKKNKKTNSRKLIRKNIKDLSEDELIVISDDDSEADNVNKKTVASNLSVETKRCKKIRGKIGNENDISPKCKERKSKSVQPDEVLPQIVGKKKQDEVEKTDVTKSKKIETESSADSVFDVEREKMLEADIKKLAIYLNEAENQVNIAENVAPKKDTTPKINSVDDGQIIQEELDGSQIKHIETFDDEDGIVTNMKTKTPISQVQCNSPSQEVQNEQNRETVNKIPDVVQSNAENTERSLVTKRGKNRSSNIIKSTKCKKTVISVKLSKKNVKGSKKKKNEPSKLVQTKLRQRHAVTEKKGKQDGNNVSETVQMSTRSRFKKKSVQPDYDAIEIVEEVERDEGDNINEESEDDIAVTDVISKKSSTIDTTNEIVSGPRRQRILETEMKEMVISLNRAEDENKIMVDNVIPKKDTTPKTKGIDKCEIIQQDAKNSQNLKKSFDNDDVMMNIVLTTKTKTTSSLFKSSSSSQDSLIFENKQSFTPIDFDKVFDALKNTTEAIHTNIEDIERSQTESLKTIDLNELTRSQQIRMYEENKHLKFELNENQKLPENLDIDVNTPIQKLSEDQDTNQTQKDDVITQKSNKSLEKSVELFSKTKQEIIKSNKQYEDQIEEITTDFEEIPKAISSVDDKVSEITEKERSEITSEIRTRPKRKSIKQRYEDEIEEITTDFEEIPKAISSVNNVIDQVNRNTEKKSSETTPQIRTRPKRKFNKQYEDKIEEITTDFEEIPKAISSVGNKVNEITEKERSEIASEIRTRPKIKSNNQRYEDEIEEITTDFEEIPKAISSVNNVVDQVNENIEKKSSGIKARPKRKFNKHYEEKIEEITTAFEKIPKAISSVNDKVNEITEKERSETTSQIRTRPKRKSNIRYEDEIEEITTVSEETPKAIPSVDNVIDQVNGNTEKKSSETTPEIKTHPKRKCNKQYEEKIEEITTAFEEIPQAIPSVDNVIDQNNEITENISGETTSETRTGLKKKSNKQCEDEIEEITSGFEEIPKAISSVNVIDQVNEITKKKSSETTPEIKTRSKRKSNKQYEDKIEEITTAFEEIPKVIPSVDNNIIDQVSEITADDTKLNSNNLSKNSTVGRKRRKLYDNTMVTLPSPEEKNDLRGFRGFETNISDQSKKQSTILADKSTNNGTFKHGKNMKIPREVERNVEKELDTTLRKVNKKKPRRSKYEVTYSEEEAKEEAFRKKCRNVVRANTTGIDEFYGKSAKRRRYSDFLEESKFRSKPITSRNYDINLTLDRNEWAELHYIIDSERRHDDGRKSSAKKEYLKKPSRNSLYKSDSKKGVNENNEVAKKKINIISNICLKPKNIQSIPQDANKYDQIENNIFQKDEENVPNAVLMKDLSWTASAFFNNEFITVNSNDFIGRYLVLFFYPFDFGELPNIFPPTEIQFFNKYFEQFQELNTNILGCSVDSIYTHKAYVNKLLHTNKSLVPIKFPLISDCSHTICKAFDVFNYNLGHSYRAVIIIDQKSEVTVKTVVEVNLEMVLDDILEYIKLQRVSSL